MIRHSRDRVPNSRLSAGNSGARARHRAKVAPRVRKNGTLVTVATLAAASVAVVSFPLSAIAEPAGPVNEQVLTAVEASWTTTRAPNTPQGDKPYLSASRFNDATYLKFDAGDIDGEAITSASLEMRVASTKATRPGIEVYPSSSSWSEDTITQANRPVHDANQLNVSSVQAVVGTVTVPLSTPLEIAADGTISFEVRYSQSYIGTNFYGVGRSTPKLRMIATGGAGGPTPDASTPPPSTPTPPQPTPTEEVPTPPVPPTPSPSVTPTPSPTTPSSSDLAFPVAASNSTEKKVFAHYFPPYPISLDNKEPAVDYYARNYLSPQGEGGRFASSGGLLRDRPEGRSPLTGDWRLADMRTEVADASRAGIDGFTINIMSVSGSNWERTLDLAEAAATSESNFTVVPNLDLTASVKDVPVSTIAQRLAELYSSPAAYRLASGEYVLSSFAAERKSVAWWNELTSTLSSKYGIRTALIAVFLSASDANMQAFAPISFSLGNWGVRTPTSIRSAPDFAGRAHALGVKWMAPVAVQDVRPRSFKYDEAGNTEALRASWDKAIGDGADMVQLVTWNDYSESTSFAPSASHGESFLDINAYYQSQFKTGVAPSITGDALYLTHRVQFVDSRPSLLQRLMLPILSGTSMKPRDTVEVMTFLRAPATVTVTIGGNSSTFEAPAGVNTKTFPLARGSIAGQVSRNGSDIATAASPYEVISDPVVQDLQYYAVGSRSE